MPSDIQSKLKVVVEKTKKIVQAQQEIKKEVEQAKEQPVKPAKK